MTRNPDRDSADENNGKYSADEEMTFEGVLKRNLRERADQREALDRLVEKDRSSSPPERNAEQHHGGQTVTEDEEISGKREALARAIGEAHASKGGSTPIATGETAQIGQYTTYEFAKTRVDDQQYYYLAQTTDQSYRRHKATLAISDLGTDWSLNAPTIERTVLQDLIGEQRKIDIRENREPVAWLTETQVDAVEDWYPARIATALSALEKRSPREWTTVSVWGQYLVADIDKEALLVGGDLKELTDRQVDVVLDSLVALVEGNTELSPKLIQSLRGSFDYPLLARIAFRTD